MQPEKLKQPNFAGSTAPAGWGRHVLLVVALTAVISGLLFAAATGSAAAAHGGEITVNETVDPVGEPFNSYGSAAIKFDHSNSHEWDFGTLSVEAQGGTTVTVPTYTGTDYGSKVQLDGSDLETAFGTQDQIDLDVMVNSTTVATATMSLEDPTTIPVETRNNPTGSPINSSFAGIEFQSDVSADENLVTVTHDGTELSSSDIQNIGTFDGISVSLSASEIDEEIGSDIGSSADYTLVYDGTTLGTTTIERVDPMVTTVDIDSNTTELRDKTVNLTFDESELSDDSALVSDTVMIQVHNSTSNSEITFADLTRSSNETTNRSIPQDDLAPYWSDDLNNSAAEDLTLIIPQSGIESVEIGSESVYQQQDGPLGGGGGSSGNQTLILVALAALAAGLVFIRD